MKVSIGMPLVMKGLQGSFFPEWARRAEAAGFASVGTLGRVVFDSHEELMVLSAAAAVTSRIGLATTVMIGPPREATMLARQAATLDNLSGGRFTLGLGTGWREEDYLATGADFSRRGVELEEQIHTIRKIWAGEQIEANRNPNAASSGPSRSYMVHDAGDMVGPIGPTVERPGGPELMLGGTVSRMLRRVAKYADAYMTGPLPASIPDPGVPSGNVTTVEKVYAELCEYAAEFGRPAPRLVTSNYVALEASDNEASARLRDYYGIGGPNRYKWPFSRAVRTADAVRAHLDSMEAIGVDESYLWPTISDYKQIDLVAAAAFDR